MSEIAEAAGVGRVTLYGHFSSRKDLIEAMTEEIMLEVQSQLHPISLTEDPQTALELLTSTSWRLLAKLSGLAAAAESELGVDRLREHHRDALAQVQQLIERGQAEGSFRADLSPQWLASCFFAVLHAAPPEIRAGRLTEAEAGPVLTSTVIALVAGSRT
ncbi:TetR/AcrR family transcriptional regulator [Arthrobacter sp. D3-16]